MRTTNINQNKWQEIWTRKGEVPLSYKNEEEKIISLMSVGAWDTPLGGSSKGIMQKVANEILGHLDVDQDARILDIGCGCGLIYYVMEHPPKEIVGIDYSESSIELARSLVDGTFYHCAAHEFPYEPNSFDGIFSIGVFLYFPGLEYSLQVLKRIVDAMKPSSTTLILDIPDLAYKEQREAARRGALSKKAFEERYKGLPHQYFTKSWFVDNLHDLGCRSEFVPFFGDDYGYKDMHFHIKFTKEG